MTRLAPSTHGRLGWRASQGSGLVSQIFLVAPARKEVGGVTQDILIGCLKQSRQLFIARKMSRGGYWTVRFSLLNKYASYLLRPLFFQPTSMQSNFAV